MKISARYLILTIMTVSLIACKDEERAQAISATGIDRLSIVTAQGQQDFVIELAVTAEQMQKGLMHREHMPVNAGMLFYFGQEAERGFYMRNTLIPLDLIFIKKDGHIHSIHENAKPLDETTIYSRGPVAAVLEINGGQARALGVVPGQIVHHTFFGNSVR